MYHQRTFRELEKIKNILLENSEKIVSGAVESFLSCELVLKFVSKANLTKEGAKKLFKHWFLTFLEAATI